MNSTQISLFNPEYFRVDDSGKSTAFFSIKKPVCINSKLISELKEIWSKNPERNLRICLHESSSATFHEMVILETPGRYYRPHKHNAKGESYHLIEGKLGVVNFEDDGQIIDSRILDATDKFLYRVGESVFHCILPLTSPVIYHESKLGPFLGEGDSLWAPWSPSEKDSENIVEFSNRIAKFF